MTHPLNGRAPQLDDVCRCEDGDLIDDVLLNELSDDDFEDDPCPHCGGRVMPCPPPVWMVEEEDDC